MIGANGVIGAVVERLNGALPAKVAAIRTARELSPHDLPDPADAVPYLPEITSLGDFPAVLVSYQDVQQEDVTLTTPELGALSETYVFVYQVEVYVLCRSRSYEETELQTQIMEAAVREVILQRKDISPDGLVDGESVVINPVKVSSSPSDVIPDNASRFVSAVVINFPVKAEEAVASPFASAGNADEMDIHPALQ